MFSFVPSSSSSISSSSAPPPVAPKKAPKKAEHPLNTNVTIQRIFRFLDEKTLRASCTVQKNWRKIGNDPEIWKNLYKALHLHCPLPEPFLKAHSNPWKTACSYGFLDDFISQSRKHHTQRGIGNYLCTTYHREIFIFQNFDTLQLLPDPGEYIASALERGVIWILTNTGVINRIDFNFPNIINNSQSFGTLISLNNWHQSIDLSQFTNPNRFKVRDNIALLVYASKDGYSDTPFCEVITYQGKKIVFLPPTLNLNTTLFDVSNERLYAYSSGKLQYWRLKNLFSHAHEAVSVTLGSSNFNYSFISRDFLIHQGLSIEVEQVDITRSDLKIRNAENQVIKSFANLEMNRTIFSELVTLFELHAKSSSSSQSSSSSSSKTSTKK